MGSFTLGAWASRPSRADLQLAARLGLTRIHLMVNDHSADRVRTHFRCYDGVVEDMKVALDLGLEVHLTSWLMPHEEFIANACDKLEELCLAGASSVEWDAEEPWTQAREGMPLAAAADFARDCLHGIRMGVTGIGYADLELDTPALDGDLEALVKLADYVVPQAYVVAPRDASSKGLKHSGIPRVLQHWGAAGKPVIAGLAAYRQADIDGCGTVGAAMRASVARARAYGCDTVMYWALRHIVGSWRVQRAIAELAGEEAKAA